MGDLSIGNVGGINGPGDEKGTNKSSSESPKPSEPSIMTRENLEYAKECDERFYEQGMDFSTQETREKFGDDSGLNNVPDSEKEVTNVGNSSYRVIIYKNGDCKVTKEDNTYKFGPDHKRISKFDKEGNYASYNNDYNKDGPTMIDYKGRVYTYYQCNDNPDHGYYKLGKECVKSDDPDLIKALYWAKQGWTEDPRNRWK